MKTTRTRMLLAGVWACFFLKTVFFAIVFPLWEGYDEFAHFAFIQHLALEGSLPDRNTPISREITESLALAPLPWSLRSEPSPSVSHDAFWKLPAEERSLRQQGLRTIRSQQRGEPQPASGRLLYEAQQPPLYYALMAPAYRAGANLPLLDRVWILRLLSVLLASLTIPLGFVLAREILSDSRLAICSLALLVSMPGPLMSLARVSNEALAIVAATALLVAVAIIGRDPFSARRYLLLGVCLGAALLTKAYFLSLLLTLLLVAAQRIWAARHGRTQLTKYSLLALATTVALAGGHYLPLWLQTGSITGEQHDVALQLVPRLTLLKQAAGAKWMGALDSTFFSHIWFGNWSFLQLRSWMYHVFAGAYTASAIGVAVLALRPKTKLQNIDRGLVRVMIVFYGCFALGLAYHVLLAFVTYGLSATTGWYIDCLAVVEAVLLPLGLMALGLRAAWVFPCLTAAFAALELFGTHIYLLPYYAGFTDHRATGFVAALNIKTLADGGWRLLAERLTVNKPEQVDLPLLAACWMGYLVAVLVPPILTFWLLGRREAANSQCGVAVEN